jgi:hypothetical protein
MTTTNCNLRAIEVKNLRGGDVSAAHGKVLLVMRSPDIEGYYVVAFAGEARTTELMRAERAIYVLEPVDAENV